METKPMYQITATIRGKSLYENLIDEINKLDFDQQYSLYLQLAKDEIMAEAKSLDEDLAKCELLVSDEDEIAEIVSNYRREKYEASLRG